MRRDLTSPEGFEALVREHQTTVFRTLQRLTGPGAHVEDLAQEVFFRLYRALPEFRGEAMLSTYLYRITVNVAQDEWKRRRRERTHLAPVPALPDDDDPNSWLENQTPDAFAGEHTRTPEQLLSDAETAAAVEQVLLLLPEIERAVLVLYHQEELSYEGIAAALHLPLNTIRTHLHRGRKRLGSLVQQRLASRSRPTQGAAAIPSTVSATATRPGTDRALPSVPAGQGTTSSVVSAGSPRSATSVRSTG